ncbi:MAG TPA: hypothetical protein VH170_08120, partial [Chthoniobacterales bacterium]|nr:hypothetical protein [Chthoniobacterales bacterium]
MPAFERLLFDHIVSSSRLSGMKGFRAFIIVLAFVGSTSFAQQPAQQPPQPNGAEPQQIQPPAPNGPGQQEPPRPPGIGSKPSTPAQNVVAVPVPMAPPQPNGPVQKSLARITATEVAPDYRAPWNAGMLGR